MVGIYDVFLHLTFVTGALALLAFIVVTLFPVLELRDRFEPFGPYQVPRSATLGGFLQILCCFVAVGVLHHATLPLWMGYPFQIGAGIVGIVAGVAWLKKDPPKERGDWYYIACVVPIQVFLLLTLLPVVIGWGSVDERLTTACLLVIFLSLFWIDAKEGRLDQTGWTKKRLNKSGWIKK